MARRRGGRSRLRNSVVGYTLLAPSLIGVGLFLIVPVFVAIAVSFESWDIISPPRWLGGANYVSILTDPEVWHSFLVTVQYTILVIPTQTVLGLGLAVLLSKKLPGSPIFRVIFALPWICAPLTLGVVWKWIFAPTGGALNALLGTRIAWLSDFATALPAVSFVSVWTQVGYVALFYLAGLTGVPVDIQDAARVDGASEVGVFWRITMPLLRPTTFFVLATSIISSFQVFDTVYAMTSGGPGAPGRTDVIAHRIYNLAFEQLDLGKASALSVVLMALLIIVTVAQQLYFRRRITYDVVN